MQNTCKKGYLYVALIVIVLMGGIILAQHGMMAEQQGRIGEPTTQDAYSTVCNISITSYGPDLSVIDRQVTRMTPLGTVGLATDSRFVRENNIIQYSIGVE